MIHTFIFIHHYITGGIHESDLVVCPEGEWADHPESESPHWSAVRWQGLVIALRLPRAFRRAQMVLHLVKPEPDRLELHARSESDRTIGDACWEVRPGDSAFGRTFEEWQALAEGPHEVS
jgi:hypothetical protein